MKNQNLVVEKPSFHVFMHAKWASENSVRD